MTRTLAALSEYHIDFSLWQPHSPDSPSSQQFVAAIRRAASGLGFFYLHNSPLSDPTRRAKMFDLVHRFFALPIETRKQIDMAKSRHFRGFCQFGDETTLYKQDMRDQVDYDPELLTKFPYLNLLGPNQFLDDEVLEGHAAIVTDWFNQSTETCRQLTTALEAALGVEKGRLLKFLDGEGGGVVDVCGQGALPYARMKTIRYPVGDIVDGIEREKGSEQGVGAHKDSGWMTLLSPSEVAGLEVQDFDGNWLPVEYIEGAIVFNFGQQVEYVTRGLFQAATHRVVSRVDAQETRFSVAWFALPALNVKMEPLEEAEIDEEVRSIWTSARQGQDIVCDVPKGDMFPKKEEEHGMVAWRTFLRSHKQVAEAWYPDAISK
ncbi:hypothetical protein HDU79_003003 [Rhizoclosmatium sp. JEL0117]|nr:hypothetical protein HDU79_003003 [Rhizoclosmatium sp. JEL0117]